MGKLLMFLFFISISSLATAAIIDMNIQENNYVKSPESSVLSSGHTNIHSVIVSVADYPGDYSDLICPPYNAIDIKDLFNKKFNTNWPMTINNAECITLSDKDATLGRIGLAFDDMSNHVDNNDLFVFYYSGHGGRGRTSEYNLQNGDVTDDGNPLNLIETPHNYPSGYTNEWILDLSSKDIFAFTLYFEIIKE